MGSGKVLDKAKRSRSYGKGLKKGAVLAVLGFVALKLGRRDGRWVWEKPAKH